MRTARTERSAWDFAVDRLARRAHTERELLAKMERAGFGAVEIAETLDRLRARGYLDDLALAHSFARAAVGRKAWGPARIARALRARGVTEEGVEAALAEVFPAGEDETITRALERFQRRRGRLADAREEKARAYRHLRARGFSAEAAGRAVHRPVSRMISERSNEENDHHDELS